MTKFESCTNEIQVRRNGREFRVMWTASPEYFRSAWKAFEDGTMEPETFLTFDRYLTPETTFLDVGAYIGAMTLYAAATVKSVIAFEADPEAMRSLCANVNFNKTAEKIQLVEKFVSDHNGAVRISSLHHGNNSGTTGVIDLGGDSWTVPCIDFLEFLTKLPLTQRLFIKMDVEGAEYDILPCCARFLSSRLDTI